MKTLGKRGRGLDPAVMAWLMTTLQLGPGIGDVHLLVKEGTAFESWARDDLRIDPSHLHFEFAAAEDALTAGRNDVLCVYPGTHGVTAEVAWDKANTHIVGCGGPNTRGHYRTSSESIMSNTQIHTATAQVGNTINVTGANCQFHNVMIQNEGSHATNYSALRVNKYGFFGKNLQIRGATGNLANADVDCGSLSVYDHADYAMFEDCYIGHNTYTIGARTVAMGGQLMFDGEIGVSGVQNVWFKRCHVTGRSNTATVGLVRLQSGQNSADRDIVFTDCLFTNFSENWVYKLNAVFVGQATGTPTFILQNCFAVGFDEWQDMDHSSMIVSNMPASYTGGGLAIVPSTDFDGA